MRRVPLRVGVVLILVLFTLAGVGPVSAAAPPVVQAVTPSSVPLEGGVRVTVTGTGFTDVVKVTVGGTAATAVKVTSSKRLQATVPARPAGRHHLRVATAAGTSTVVAADLVTYVRPTPADTLAPRAPAVSDDFVDATFRSTDAGEGTVSGVAGFRWSTTSAAEVSGGGGTYVAANEGVAAVALPAGDGRRSLHVVAVDEVGNVSGVTSREFSTPLPGWSAPTTVLTPAGSPVVRRDETHDALTVACHEVGRCVAVDGHGGAISFEDGEWGSAEQVTRASGGFEAVSCGAPERCQAIDADGVAWSFDGDEWSDPTPVSGPVGGRGSVLLSCSSASFCLAAMDDSDAFYVFDGGSWGGAQPLPGADSTSTAVGLSCTSNSFCLFTRLGDPSYLWDGKRWAERTKLGDSDVSCWADGRCLAVANDGTTRVLEGKTWTTSASRATGASSALRSLSCSVDACLRVATNRVEVFDGQRWTAGESTPVYYAGLACVPGYCLALSPPPYRGETTEITSTGIRAAKPYPKPDHRSLSCPADGSCHLVDLTGRSAVRTNGAWTVVPSGVLTTEFSAVPSMRGRISCLSVSQCMTVGSLNGGAPGYAFPAFATYNGSAWSDSRLVSRDFGALASVSCGAPTSCVAGSIEGGTVHRWTGSTWSGPTQVILRFGGGATSPVVRAVSCAGPDFCAAVGVSSYKFFAVSTASIFREGRWEDPVQLGTSFFASLIDLSCTSETFCMALDSVAGVRTFDGASWSAGSQVPGATPGVQREATSLSCASATFCMLVADDQVQTWDGSTWSAPQVVAGASALDDVSCGTPTSCSVVTTRGEVVSYERP